MIEPKGVARWIITALTESLRESIKKTSDSHFLGDSSLSAMDIFGGGNNVINI